MEDPIYSKVAIRVSLGAATLSIYVLIREKLGNSSQQSQHNITNSNISHESNIVKQVNNDNNIIICVDKNALSGIDSYTTPRMV